MRDLNAIAFFVEVARSGSFSAAARKLSVPLSTVSRKVSQLEDELGVRLLERSTRKLRLTAAGGEYFEHCNRGVDAFKAADLIVLGQKREIAGILRITVPPNLAESLFIPLIGKFQKQFPKAKVSITVTERILDLVDDSIDLSFRVCSVKDSTLVSRKLASFRHIVVASPMYIAKYGVPETPADLKNHRLIGFGFWNKSTVQWELSSKSDKKTISFEPTIAVNDYAAVARAVESGLGIGELPSILCQQALREKSLVRVLSTWNFPIIDFVAVHTGKRNMPRIARAFLDICIEHVNSGIDSNVWQ